MPLFHVLAAAPVFIMEIVVPYDIGYVPRYFKTDAWLLAQNWVRAT